MKRFSLCLLLAGCISSANAEDVPARRASDLERQGSSPQKFGFVFEAEGTAFSGNTAAGNDICWPDGTQIVVSCSDQQFACWSMADADDITLTLATMTITDAQTAYGDNGRGACARIEAGSYRTFVLDLDVFDATSMVARRTSSCSGSSAGIPCHDNGDCPSGTCSVTGGATCARLLASATTCAGAVE